MYTLKSTRNPSCVYISDKARRNGENAYQERINEV
jgi:hypothetical protein